MTLSKLLTCALLALTLTACGSEDDDTNNATTNNAGNNTNSAVAAGKVVWDGNSCAGCHGADGKKVGVPGPATDALTSAAIQGKTDAALSDSIKNGKGSMPAYNTLSDVQITNVIAFIRSLK
jgi:mono/diheme cytochrome c family protein